MPQAPSDQALGAADASWKLIPSIDNTPHAAHVGPFYYKRVGDDNTLLMGWRIAEHNLNAMGYAHGGALMTFADYSLASSAMRHPTDRVVTVQFDCRFINPAPRGSWVESHLTLIRKGSLCFINGELLIRQRTILQFNGVTKNLD